MVLPTGELQVTRYQLTPDQALHSPEDLGSHAGPFLYAEQQGKQFEVQQKVDTALKALNAIGHHVEQRAAHLSNKTNQNVALLDRVTETDGRYLVSAVNLNDGSIQMVEISSEQANHLKAAREILGSGYEYLKPYLTIQESGHLSVQERAEGQPSSMNGAFFAMALLRSLNQRDPTSAEKLSLYWNLGGMATAVAGDGVEFGKTVCQLLAAGGEVERSLQILGKVFQVANGLSTAGALGLDIYELTKTDDPVKRLGIEIGLAFNGAALALQGGSALASWIAPTAAGAATAFGSLAIPLAGLGFGFSALGTQIQQNNQRVHTLLNYFVRARYAYLRGGMEKKNDLLIPRYPAIITKLDFKSGKITFGSQHIAKSQSQGWYAPNLIYNFENEDWERFDLREAFEVSSEAPLDTNTKWVLIPDTPNTDIDYDYLNTAPSPTPEEERVAKILQQTGNFATWNSNKSLGAALTSSRGFKYQPLTIELILDQTPRGLLFHAEIDPNISYRIVGNGGKYTLNSLPFGINFKIEDQPTAPSSYLLQIRDATLLGEDDARLDQGFLIIKNQQNKTLRIDISNLHPNSKLTVVGTIAQWEADIWNSRLSTLDLRHDSSLDAETYLRKMANQGKAKATVLLIQGEFPSAPKKNAREEEWLIYQHQLQMAERLSIHTAYDSTAHRIIAPTNNYPAPQTVLKESNQILVPWIGSKFIALTEKYAFFFNQRTQSLWCTNRTTNQAIASYPLVFANSESRIEDFSQDGTSFRLVTPLPSNRELTFVCVIREGELMLEAIENLNHEELSKLDPSSQNNSNRIQPLQQPDSKFNFAQSIHNALLPMAGSLPKIKVAEWLKVQGTDAKGYLQRLLINLEKKRAIPVHLLANTLSVTGLWGQTTFINFEHLKQSNGYPVDLAASDFKVIATRKSKEPSGGWNVFLQFRNNAKICEIPAVPRQSLGPTFLMSGNGKVLIENPFDTANLRNLADNKKGQLIPYLGLLYFVTENGELFLIAPNGSQTPLKYSGASFPPAP